MLVPRAGLAHPQLGDEDIHLAIELNQYLVGIVMIARKIVPGRVSCRTPRHFDARRPQSVGGRCVVPDGRVQANVDACSSHTVHWEINQIPGGQRVITDGIDYVSSVLENNQWRLCHSDFIGSSRNGLTRVESMFTSIAPRGPVLLNRYARPIR